MLIEDHQYLCPLVCLEGLVVWAANSDLVVYSNGETKKFSAHTDTIRGISILDSNTLATGGEDKQVMIWKKQHNNEWHPTWKLLHSKRIMSVQFDKEGTLFFADKFGEFYTVKEDKASLMFGHLSAVSCMHFGGDFLVSADRDEKIRLAKYPQVEVIESYLFGHKRYVCHLVANTDNTQLVSAGADGRVICWDISNWELPKQLWTVQLEEGPINSVAIHNSSVHLVRAAENTKIITMRDGEVGTTCEKTFSIQTLHVISNDIACVDTNSHLHLRVLTDDALVSIGDDVAGIGITLMKTVHHENVDENSSFKKKRSEG